MPNVLRAIAIVVLAVIGSDLMPSFAPEYMEIAPPPNISHLYRRCPCTLTVIDIWPPSGKKVIFYYSYGPNRQLLLHKVQRVMKDDSVVDLNVDTIWMMRFVHQYLDDEVFERNPTT